MIPALIIAALAAYAITREIRAQRQEREHRPHASWISWCTCIRDDAHELVICDPHCLHREGATR